MESASRCPLVVDFDGTLITSDSLIESLLALSMQSDRHKILTLIPSLVNKAKFKSEIASLTNMPAMSWPYRQDLLNYLISEREKGRKIYLATGANEKIAAGVLQHLEIFDGHFASTDTLNLTGTRKAEALIEKFGVKGFSYVGNHRVDGPIWEVAQSVYFAGPVAKLQRMFKGRFTAAGTFPDPSFSPKVIVKAVRVHQWVKNLLVFVPLLFAHRIFDASLLLHCLLAFFAFSFSASSAYLINDLADLGADRAHPLKKKRPFASGRLNVLWGIFLSPVLLLAGFAIATQISTAFLLTLLAYFSITYLYSFMLKRIVLVDVFTLATLYTIRIFAGAIASGTEISAWLLAFSIFIFFDLAIVKRVSELMMMKKMNKDKSTGRGYRVRDIDVLKMFGICSGFLSVMVLSLYISNDKVTILYRNPYLLWFICPVLLYWICRIWMITERGNMHSDPIVFALKDRSSYVIAVICGIIGWFAI